MAISLPTEHPSACAHAAEGVVDVWCADLDATGTELEELLCAGERERAAGIVRDRARARWVRSRGLLRAVLGSYLERDPRSLRFELGAHGKPALSYVTEGASGRRSGPGPDGGLRFNLSHSGELALVAVTAGREIGVDVERERERCTAGFLRAWTVREAAVKCLGTGLASAPVSPEGSQAAEIWTAELDVGPRAAAAVAVAGGEECELRCWDSAPTLTPWPL